MPNKRYQNTLNNPHLVDWYFGLRLNKFAQYFFDDILDVEWRWHRFEWQSRSSIHAHGCARLKNDPGLIKLTALVYIGRKAAEKICNTENLTSDEKNKLEKDILLGQESGLTT